MTHFAMFAKYWEAGKVKTRLARAVGNELARDVYLIFLRHLVKRFGNFADARSIVFSPPESMTLFRKVVGDHWRLQPQSKGDLGIRMKNFFRQNSQLYSQNILVGSDTPDLPVAFAQQASDMLNDASVILGPSGDGGYYLVAMKGQVDNIFDDIPWSTDQVLPMTLEKLDQQRVSYQLLPELKDIDEFDDLRQLIRKLIASSRDPLDEQLLDSLAELELPHV